MENPIAQALNLPEEHSAFRPATPLEVEALNFLNALRESGEVNMFGAAPYLEAELGVARQESLRLFTLWMENFNPEGDYTTLKNQPAI